MLYGSYAGKIDQDRYNTLDRFTHAGQLFVESKILNIF